MGRRLRLPSQSGCYHVVVRGNNRQIVFRAEADFQVYLQLMNKYRKIHAIGVHHYCLMSNHAHQILRTEKVLLLSRFMHDVQRTYFLYRQREEDFSGHLWQGRFWSDPIEDEAHLLECGRYVERNPLNAKLVEDPVQYPWSSYSFYAAGTKDPIVTPSPVYSSFGNTDDEKQRAYRSYVCACRPERETAG